ncbi:MAG: UbiA prenyltransferase family protein [Bacteroidia bacterium]|nr:UbiA prenyltransferase family protein [Bacteroidia bacterium]
MSSHIYTFSLLIITIVILPLLFFILQKNLLYVIVNDIRLGRILHYVALMVFGASLFYKTSYAYDKISLDTLLLFFLFTVTLVYAAVFAIVTNNIEDIDADKITNPHRPLVKNIVQQQPYFLAGVTCLVVALLTAILVDVVLFTSILLISVGYYIYSCRPFRLKRIPFLSKFIIGLNSLIVAMGAFCLAGGTLTDFPLLWLIFILFPLSLSANFVDLKDIEGDRQTGIKTLPVFFGEKRALIIISVSTFITYIFAAVILNIFWVYPLVILSALLHIWFLFKKPYKEAPVFFVFLSGIFGLSVLLYLS